MSATMRRYLLVFQALLWLCLIQCLRAVFSSLFGVIYDSLFEGSTGMSYAAVAGLALLLAFLLPAVGGRLPARGILVAGAVALVARIVVSLDAPALRLWAGMVAVGAAFAALTGALRRDERRSLDALIIALLIDQISRAIGATWDLSLQAWWWPVQIILALFGLWLAKALWSERAWEWESGLTLPAGVALSALLFLHLNLLGLPGALARWSGEAYAWVAPALFAVSLAGVWIGRGVPGQPGLRLTLGFTMAGGLLLGHYLPGIPGAIGLLLAAGGNLGMIAALPCGAGRPRTGSGMVLGNALFLILSFGLAFAFTYPYTLPALKGTGIIWYLAAALMSLIGIWGGVASASTPRRGPALAAALFGVGLILMLALPQPAAVPADRVLRLATYNIHYGYDTEWRLSLARQADALEAAGVDVVALQEVDAGRITSFSIDNALWLAQRLNMHSVYLPAVEHLTGIALLSRYPILDTATILYPSEEEATGLIHARLLVRDAGIDAFATWLGLSEEERVRQIAAAVEWMALRSPEGPAFFAGDLNSRPDSPTYQRLSRAGFADPFRDLGLGDPPTSPAIRPHGRIDFVRTRDLTPVDAGVDDSLASDHRMVWVDVALP